MMKAVTICVILTLCCLTSVKTAPSLEKRSISASGAENQIENGQQLLSAIFRSYFSNAQESSSWSRCTLCKVTTTMIREFFEKGKAETDLIATIKWGCKFFKVQSPTVCDGIVNQFQDEMFYVLQRTALSSTDICALVFNTECGYPSHQMNWTVKTTSIPKPPVKPLPLPQKNAPKLRVLHISDVHIDPLYEVNTAADCNEPLCCHSSSISAKSGGGRKAGKWGSFETCDLPERSFENMLQYIRDNVQIDYAIWTGDIIPHMVWNVTRESNIQQMRRFHQLLRDYLPNVPIYLALGNHESVPVDSFPISSITGNRSIEWLYKELVQQWSPWLPSYTNDTIIKGGYYVHRNVFPGLRIISLNMNYCNNMNWWLLINSTDPANELSWLVDELQDAENAGDHVHILGHIPPGASECFAVWSDNYNNIVNRYESTIRGQFFGHTHFDEFEIFYDSENVTRPYGVAFVGPSVTTFGTGNPSFRVYTIDGNYTNSTWSVLDHETYYMNLTDANANPDNAPTWYKGYSMKSKFGLVSLSPAEYDEFVKQLSYNVPAFERFYKLYNHDVDTLSASCDSSCKKQLLCHLSTTRSGKFDFCTNA